MGPGRPPGKVVTRVRVAGRTAALTRAHVRFCIGGRGGASRCQRARILTLSWTGNGHSCRVTGLRERPAHIIGFARHLVPVS
ncbi:MAG: hypothetical protein ACLP7J_10260 [Streptosporangiaceae bacterium]